MNCFLSSFYLDIDPVSIIPYQPQVVMLGDKVEWQCKTKASAAHTVQWKKVCVQVLPQSSLAIPFMECKNVAFPRMENASVRKQLPEHSWIIVVKTSSAGRVCEEDFNPAPNPVWIISDYSFFFCRQQSRFTASDRKECVKVTHIGAQLSFDTAALRF